MAGTAINDTVKQDVFRMLASGASKAEVSRQLGIDWGTVAKYASKGRPGVASRQSDEGPFVSAANIQAPTTIDLATIIAEVVRRMNGSQANKPDVVEVVAQAPVKLPVHPQSRCVDLSGKQYERTAFISDLHCPFQSKAAVAITCKAIRDYKPNCLIIGGDFFDCFSISDHDRSPGRVQFLQDEFDASRPTIKEIDDAAGDADIWWVDGNHEYRLQRLLHKSPGLFSLRSLEIPIAAELPKRWLYHPNQTRFKLGALSALHGDLRARGNSVQHPGYGMLKKLRMSCLFGHLHRFQSYYERAADGSIRAGFANACLCDIEQADWITSPDWQEGFSTLDFDWSLGIFSVAPHLIVKQALRWGGKTYSASAA